MQTLSDWEARQLVDKILTELAMLRHLAGIVPDCELGFVRGQLWMLYTLGAISNENYNRARDYVEGINNEVAK